MYTDGSPLTRFDLLGRILAPYLVIHIGYDLDMSRQLSRSRDVSSKARQTYGILK